MKSVERLLLVLIPATVVIVSALLGLVVAQKGYTICDVQGCNCTVPAGRWKNVNCNLLDDQVRFIYIFIWLVAKFRVFLMMVA